jgi:Tfp pilus assembly protein PilO
MTQTRKWTAVTAAVAVLVLVAGWFLLVRPQHSKADTLKAQAAAQQQANQVLQTQIASLRAEQKNLPQEQKVLQKLASQLPDTDAEPALIRQLSTVADGSGVDLSSVTPGQAAAVSSTGSTTLGSTSTAGLMQIPLSMTISGAYANIESFFQSLEKMPRSVLVTGVSLSYGDKAITGTLTTTVFYASSSTSDSSTATSGTAATATSGSTSSAS